jgi:hypothetical protein
MTINFLLRRLRYLVHVVLNDVEDISTRCDIIPLSEYDKITLLEYPLACSIFKMDLSSFQF